MSQKTLLSGAELRQRIGRTPQSDDPQPLIIYHGPRCADGFGAALAAWLFYGDRAQYLPLDHGQIDTLDALPPLAGRAVYVLDFSLPAPLLHGMAAQAQHLVLLDHHRSAADALQGVEIPNASLLFDLNQSGAVLAWRYFWPDRPVPELLRCVQDRDLWRWQLPDSADFLAALDVQPQSFERWQQLMTLSPTEQQAFLAQGQAMRIQFDHLCQGLARAAAPIAFNGVRGLMANAPGVFHSQLGDLLSRQSGSFALLWTVDEHGRVKCGLRSQPGFDCIPLAQSLDGGGHPQACGFRLPPERLPELLQGRLQAAP
ncbi:MAG: hypothetical protein Fur007_07590 [Rhodoferax sp.]